METQIEIEPTLADLVVLIKQSFADDLSIQFKKKQIHVKPYGYDDRINWDTHIVTIDEYGVFGFTDGPIKS